MSVIPSVVCDWNPPVESRLPLSKMMWMRLAGRYRAMVARVPMFIRTDPSPSMTTTCSSGKVRAKPRPMDEVNGIIAQTRGRMALAGLLILYEAMRALLARSR